MGLNAVLGWPQGIRPTSKNNRHLQLAVASSCHLVVHCEISSYFIVEMFKPYPSAVIQWGGRVGLFSVPHGKLIKDTFK